MNILEEFWYRNIEPAEYDASPSKEYKEMLQLPQMAKSFAWSIMFFTMYREMPKYAVS